MSTRKSEFISECCLESLQKEFPTCPRKKCGCKMVPVLARYGDHGVINNEFECPHCGKIKKDPVMAEQRRQQYLARKAKQQQR